MAAAADQDIPPDHPVAVLSHGRVLSCSAVARARGVQRGMRKREVQAVCSSAHVATDDYGRNARYFEAVVAAVAAVVPAVEILRPGLMLVSVTTAVRRLGPEEMIAEMIVDEISSCGVESQIGVADELFTAVLAARHGVLVNSGESTNFLSPLGISEIGCEPALCVGPDGGSDRAELIDLLWRLGIRTIGAFAQLSSTDVSSRFGADAIAAHRHARALPSRPVSARPPAADLSVEHRCDPPVEVIEAAAFIGRRLADDCHTRLMTAGVACTRLSVHAITMSGVRYSRTWRCASPLTPDATADRIRWQLEGWLAGRNAPRPNSPIAILRLEPVEVIDAGEMQYGFAGAGLPMDSETQERARRSLVRVQGLLGADAVQIPVRSGGRGPAEQITLVPLGDDPVVQRNPQAPWPGRMSNPAPAVLFRGSATTHSVQVHDDAGQAVEVTSRGGFTDEPASVTWQGRRRPVQWWAGPWSADERWWVPGESEVCARAQVLLDDQCALLLRFDHSGWRVEGVYE